MSEKSLDRIIRDRIEIGKERRTDWPKKKSKKSDDTSSTNNKSDDSDSDKSD